MSEKAIVAMSGGVDSTVAACFAKKEGLDVIGVTLRLFENETAGISCTAAPSVGRGGRQKRGLQAGHSVLCVQLHGGFRSAGHRPVHRGL